MKANISIMVLAVSAMALAGCSSTSGGSSGGGGSGGGSGLNLPSYNVTQYQAGQTLAQVQASGIEGIAATSGGHTVAEVTKSGDDLTIVAGGQTYQLHRAGTESDPASGLTLDLYTDDPSNPEQIGIGVDGQYVGLAAVGDVLSETVETIVVTGQQTVNVPNQTAEYTGYWLSAGAEEDIGDFTAQADFGNNSISYNVSSAATTGAGSGKISGAQFAGDITLGGVSTGRGTVAGAFYGPNADEIAGTSTGTYLDEDYVAGFYGMKD